ncbi:MAG: nucleoside hydrolase [bacterium]
MPAKKEVRRAVLIDCDPGVDDALALALALASPELDVRAVTTVHGNVPARWAYRNARRAVAYFQGLLKDPASPPPVLPGEALPLRRRRIDRRVSFQIHGKDGLGDLFRSRKPVPPPRGPNEPAPQVISNLARRMGKSLTLIAMGPLTNLAVALRQDRRALAGVGGIVVMGGAARMPGNVTASAEFNVHCDPDAAEVVLNCGAPVTLVGLDVTRRAVLPSRTLLGGGPFRRALRDLVRPYAAFSKRRRGVDGTTLHDPLAVAVAIDPGLVRSETRQVSVECGDGPARGMTVVDLRADALPARPGACGVKVAFDLDEKRFLRFFLSRLEAYRGWS